MFKHYMKQGWQYNLWPQPNKMRQNCQFPALGEKQPHNIGKGASQKKIRDFLGVFHKCWTPPPPPPPLFGRPPFKKKFRVYFAF